MRIIRIWDQTIQSACCDFEFDDYKNIFIQTLIYENNTALE